MFRRNGTYVLVVVFLAVMVAGVYFNGQAKAQSTGGISLQVAPSPLVSTIKPGESKTLELKIRNNGTQYEQLKIELRSFTQNSVSGQINLNDTAPSDISSWVSFSAPNFNVQPGEWFNENVTINMPKDAGFSYSFAILISRQNENAAGSSQLAVQGSLAVFTLINVDRADATRQLEIGQFSIEHRLYEYLPVKFNVTLKNGGNTIVQPYGNIFIQRNGDSKTPISVLPLNEAKAYILPNTSRIVSSEWQNGFPVYVSAQSNDSSKSRHLEWDWDDIKNLRFGKYTAKLVGVYNDGQRDVPLEAQLTFWVIPWKLIIGLVVVMAILLIGIYTIIKKGIQITPRRRKHVPQHVEIL